MKCRWCGNDLYTDCNGQPRCETCDPPCPSCDDGGQSQWGNDEECDE